MVSHPVDISTAFSRAIEVPGADQVGNNALGGTLGDVEKNREIPNANPGVPGDQEERVAVICEQPEVRNGAQGQSASPGQCPNHSDIEYRFQVLPYG